MRIASTPFLLLLAALALVGLAACDVTGEQNIQWEAGDDLIIKQSNNIQNDVRAFDGFAPSTIYFLVQAPSSEWDYQWNVSPSVPSSEFKNQGEFFRIQVSEPGTYTVTTSAMIEGETYDDTLSVEVAAPTAAGQLGRLPQFSTLNSVLGASSVSIPESAVTVLAPSNEALAARFDADGEDGVEADELPADSVLTDILETHVIPQTVAPDEIGGGPYTTLEGEQVTFEVNGDDTTAVIENDMGEVSRASVSTTGLPVADGILYTLDGLLTPGSSEVQFNDQTAVDSVNVRSVYLPDGGFVAIHESNDGEVGRVIGVSEKLDADIQNSVPVALFNEELTGGSFEQDSLQADQTLIAMPHRDTDGDGTYDFITPGGEDGPYTEDGAAVTDPAAITVGEE